MNVTKNVCIMRFGVEDRAGRKCFYEGEGYNELQMIYDFNERQTCGVAKNIRIVNENELYADLYFDDILVARSYDTATVAGTGRTEADNEIITELTRVSIISTSHSIKDLDNNVLHAKNDLANYRTPIRGYRADLTIADEATYGENPIAAAYDRQLVEDTREETPTFLGGATLNMHTTEEDRNFTWETTTASRV